MVVGGGKEKMMIGYELEDAIKRVLRNTVGENKQAVRGIGELIEWALQNERAKVGGASPKPLLCVLSGLGIYGGKTLERV